LLKVLIKPTVGISPTVICFKKKKLLVAADAPPQRQPAGRPGCEIPRQVGTAEAGALSGNNLTVLGASRHDNAEFLIYLCKPVWYCIGKQFNSVYSSIEF
jgi:hypothetical protein